MEKELKQARPMRGREEDPADVGTRGGYWGLWGVLHRAGTRAVQWGSGETGQELAKGRNNEEPAAQGGRHRREDQDKAQHLETEESQARQARQHLSVIPGHSRLRQEDCHGLKTSPGYIMRH